MGKVKRSPISKRTRFEVFKRDQFTCQYCGAHPPNVLLEIDHIEAIANGGGNEIDNLVTACEPCNRGKSAVKLTSVPQSLREKADAVAEAELQLRGYHWILEGQRQRKEQDAWRIAEILDPGCGKRGFPTANLRSIKRFNDELGLFRVIEAAEIAVDRVREYQRFRYFCGICWKWIRPVQEPSE